MRSGPAIPKRGFARILRSRTARRATTGTPAPKSIRANPVVASVAVPFPVTLQPSVARPKVPVAIPTQANAVTRLRPREPSVLRRSAAPESSRTPAPATSRATVSPMEVHPVEPTRVRAALPLARIPARTTATVAMDSPVRTIPASAARCAVANFSPRTIAPTATVARRDSASAANVTRPAGRASPLRNPS
jgi:hypothetical protein